ncbi:MAG: AAA family ATPase, partial [Actinomycetota bacterium]
MFLKSLALRGFKSFADRTTLELEPGITVVVGPNGSGKSNVVDAVSWVLGEQGPRALRGGRMEDVIFAGSRLRPALSMAEVCLTIDNSARRLPLDLGEVTISRTLFRSGESEYRINGATCRLLDVQELLSDAGVGREQHTIIGQGSLESTLAADPMQVRAVIEEAAGVAKHRRRRERAMRKIAGAEANLARLSDLLSEIRRQLRPLREQAEVAKRHAALAEDLARVRLVLAARELAGLRAKLGPEGAADLEGSIGGAEAE